MLNVVCLKHGIKYSPDYVNKLYNMVQRHLTIPHKFVCFTENPSGLLPEIEIRPLPVSTKFSGWWWKPYLFKQGHFAPNDINLFFDLDMVIIGNIDNLVTYLPGEFVGLEDVGRVFKPNFKKLGSAVMRWTGNNYENIWTELDDDPNLIRKFQGDQDWIWYKHKSTIKFFPENWIRSYKWEIRDRSELIRQGGKYIFKEIRDPTIPAETSILAFHGTPNPEDVQDPIIIDNWR